MCVVVGGGSGCGGDVVVVSCGVVVVVRVFFGVVDSDVDIRVYGCCCDVGGVVDGACGCM